MRQTDDDLVVTYHCEKKMGRFYTDNTLFTILPKRNDIDLKFLLALFNSRLMNFLYHCFTQEQGKSQAQVKVNTVKCLPVVSPSQVTQRAIIKLVDRIVSIKDVDPIQDTGDWEVKIDQLIYQLYGLTCEEIAVVEGH